MRGSSLICPPLCTVLILVSLPTQAVQIIGTVAGGGPNNIPAPSANVATPYSVVADASGNFFISASATNQVFRVNTSGLLTLVAGNGAATFAGDGGPATSASLRFPKGVALDAAGNLFIADSSNHRIRRVDAATGIISTVAGNGSFGFAGDGGPATSATLNQPDGVALDAAGNLFIADFANRRIRRVDAMTGIISTIAGNGAATFAGDGGPATSASLFSPTGVALDAAGNLFIADIHNHRIRRVDAATGIISTVAGNGTATFAGDGGPATSASLLSPIGVAIDAAGNLFIADISNHRIRRVDAATGIISTVAGNGAATFAGDGGPATSAGLNRPYGVALDAAGNLFVADNSNNRIRRVDATTAIISTVAGNGTRTFAGDGYPATSATLNHPFGVALDAAGNLFIADAFNNRIRRVDATTAIISTVAGNGTRTFTGDGGPATSASLYRPFGVALDTAGNLFIADSINNRIRRVDATTGIISTVAGNGTNGFAGDGGPATSARLHRPFGVALDAAGNLFIADSSNYRIRRVDATTGIISTVAGNGTNGFAGDGGPATSARLHRPFGVTLGAAGNLFIADTNNNRIRRVDATTGIISTVAGNGIFGFAGDGGSATNASLRSPTGMALDAAGNLFIADTNNTRIRRVDSTTAIISTVAGNGTGYFAGDGGPATSASLADTRDVAVDTTGNLFIADASNNRIRRVLTVNRPPLADLVFAPPLIANASAAFKEIKVGRTIPVKFRLTSGDTSAATIAVFRILDIATGSLDSTDLVADAGSANFNENLFRFDRIAQQYIFNLSTKDFPAPATYRIFVTLDDGSQKSVDFALRR